MIAAPENADIQIESSSPSPIASLPPPPSSLPQPPPPPPVPKIVEDVASELSMLSDLTGESAKSHRIAAAKAPVPSSPAPLQMVPPPMESPPRNKPQRRRLVEEHNDDDNDNNNGGNDSPPAPMEEIPVHFDVNQRKQDEQLQEQYYRQNPVQDEQLRILPNELPETKNPFSAGGGPDGDEISDTRKLELQVQVKHYRKKNYHNKEYNYINPNWKEMAALVAECEERERQETARHMMRDGFMFVSSSASNMAIRFGMNLGPGPNGERSFQQMLSADIYEAQRYDEPLMKIQRLYMPAIMENPFAQLGIILGMSFLAFNEQRKLEIELYNTKLKMKEMEEKLQQQQQSSYQPSNQKQQQQPFKPLETRTARTNQSFVANGAAPVVPTSAPAPTPAPAPAQPSVPQISQDQLRELSRRALESTPSMDDLNNEFESFMKQQQHRPSQPQSKQQQDLESFMEQQQQQQQQPTTPSTATTPSSTTPSRRGLGRGGRQSTKRVGEF